MRVRSILPIIALSLVLFGVTVSATLRIDRFDATIDLDENGILHVTERLAVVFYSPHHGIEREIPVSYRNPNTKTRTTIDLDLVEVTLDDRSVPFTQRRKGSDIVLRIGDPDRRITGTHVYTMVYTVGRAILFHEDYLQVYWNVTGNEWRIPIDQATCIFRLPSGIDMSPVRSTSYTGRYGSTSRGLPASMTEDGGLLFTATHLSFGEGLTIDVSIPRDVLPIAPPSIASRILWFLDANKWAALPIVVLAGMILLWARVGRDPRKGTIAPQVEPPQDLHAGEVGVLIDDHADLRDISAMVIGLAVDGHLRIEEIHEDETSGDRARTTLDKSAGDYRFVRQPLPAASLSKAEKLLLDAIFNEEHPDERTISSLECEFYKTLPNLKSKLYGSLIAKRYYPHNPERTRRSYLSLGLIGAGCGVAAGIANSSLYLAVALGLCGLIVAGFSWIMPRKTQLGVRALEQVLGLSEYIRRAEVDRIEFHDAPQQSPKEFEKLLPYAIALNLTSIWTRQFEGLLQEPPDWYVGRETVFHPHLFTLSMLHLSSGMEHAFVTAPRAASGGRSAWGGGSSFGGGFSGGGFGGGGGGGW